MALKVHSIRGDGQLYQAARKVFQIPSLTQLWDRKGLDEFFSFWEESSGFIGPGVYFDRQGFPSLIETEASKRLIRLLWTTDPRGKVKAPDEFGYQSRLEAVIIEFPGGSLRAAGKIIQKLREMEARANIFCSQEDPEERNGYFVDEYPL